MAPWSRRCPNSGRRRFSIVNADTIWIDGVQRNLARLAEAFDPAAMDALLLLAPTTGSIGYAGPRRFQHGAGRPAARAAGEREVVPFVFAGAAILTPALFADAPSGEFSL